MEMKKSILRDCLSIAIDYLPKHPEFHYYPLYSFIIQNNKIIEWDTNDSGTPDHTIYPMYQSRVAHLDGTPKRHAEVNAWRKAKGIINKLKPFEVVNIRLNREGQVKLAAPCSCCTCFLKSLNASHTYFTTDAGWAKLTF